MIIKYKNIIIGRLMYENIPFEIGFDYICFTDAKENTLWELDIPTLSDENYRLFINGKFITQWGGIRFEETDLEEFINFIKPLYK